MGLFGGITNVLTGGLSGVAGGLVNGLLGGKKGGNSGGKGGQNNLNNRPPADPNQLPVWAVSKSMGKTLADTMIKNNPALGATDEAREGLESVMSMIMKPVCKNMFPNEYAKERKRMEEEEE